MPITGGGGETLTTTVQTIINGASQDIRRLLNAQVGSTDVPILMDYTNRVCLQLMRVSNWRWLLSPIQSFVTQMGVNDYWIGPTGSASPGSSDTGLNIGNIRRVREDSVLDRSNFKKLHLMGERPLTTGLAFPDGTSRYGRPQVYRNDVDSPYVLSLYPAPDNQNNYYPIPEAPICTSVTAGGSLPARVYYIRVSFIDSLGNEGAASTNETQIYIPANFLVTVQPPLEPLNSATGIKYNRYNIYAATYSNGETLQNNSPQANAWTEPTSGLTSNGTTWPTTSSYITPIDGYLIEFRYWMTRQQLINVGQIIQIPDEYKDVVIAGVNWLVAEYIKRPTDGKIWQDIYGMGIQSILRDKHLFPHGGDYIGCDNAALNATFPAVEVTDPSITRTN